MCIQKYIVIDVYNMKVCDDYVKTIVIILVTKYSVSCFEVLLFVMSFNFYQLIIPFH